VYGAGGVRRDQFGGTRRPMLLGSSSMTLIPPPPAYPAGALTADLLGRMIETGAFRPTVGDLYVHWDRLRHFEEKAVLSHEEWWAAIQLARKAIRHRLPLRDVAGAPFQYAVPEPLHRALAEIDRDLAGSAPVPAAIADPSTRGRFLMTARVEEAVASARLEGATLVRDAAVDLLRSGRAPTTPDERAIRNLFDAMRHVRAGAASPLTPERIREIHGIVTAGAPGLSPDEIGRFRTRDDVRLVAPDGEVLHTPPPARELETRIARLCEFANDLDGADGWIHPVARAALVHFFLGYIHPFCDGSGPVARALFYDTMLRAGYPLVEYVSLSSVLAKAPAEYGRAYLCTETDENDTTYFVLHQVDALARAIEAMRRSVDEKTKARQRTHALLGGEKTFNSRQLALLGHAMKHPGARYTAIAHAACHMVPDETGRADLEVLATRGLITSVATGNLAVYHRPADFVARLEAAGRTHRAPST